MMIELQGFLTAIGIDNNEDIAAPRSRNWTPISYAHAKLQFTHNITRLAEYDTPKNITVRPLMTFQQQGQDQPIHRFLGVVSNPRRYCYKIWEKMEKKLSSNSSQARCA